MHTASAIANGHLIWPADNTHYKAACEGLKWRVVFTPPAHDHVIAAFTKYKLTIARAHEELKKGLKSEGIKAGFFQVNYVLLQVRVRRDVVDGQFVIIISTPHEPIPGDAGFA
jgi:hypothetical protein